MDNKQKTNQPLKAEDVYSKVLGFLPLAKSFAGIGNISLKEAEQFLDRASSFLKSIEKIFGFEDLKLDDAHYLMIKFKAFTIKKIQEELDNNANRP